MSSARHWAQFFCYRPAPGFYPPAIVPNITRHESAVHRSSVLQEEGSFADGCLNAPTLCLLESLGELHEVVGALSSLEANAP